MTARPRPEDRPDHRVRQPPGRSANHTQDTDRPPEYVVEAWVSEQLRGRIQRNKTFHVVPMQEANTQYHAQTDKGATGRSGSRTVNTAQDHRPGTSRAEWFARLQRQLSDRVFADGDAFARRNGWQITQTTGRSGFSARSYRDPRFGQRAAAACQARNNTVKGVW